MLEIIGIITVILMLIGSCVLVWAAGTDRSFKPSKEWLPNEND